MVGRQRISSVLKPGHRGERARFDASTWLPSPRNRAFCHVSLSKPEGVARKRQGLACLRLISELGFSRKGKKRFGNRRVRGGESGEGAEKTNPKTISFSLFLFFFFLLKLPFYWFSFSFFLGLYFLYLMEF